MIRDFLIRYRVPIVFAAFGYCAGAWTAVALAEIIR